MTAKTIGRRLGAPHLAKQNDQKGAVNTSTDFPICTSLACIFPRFLQSIAKRLMVDTSSNFLQIRDNPAPKGCIGSASALKFEMYISSKMPHNV
jgi:hypothetical protein